MALNNAEPRSGRSGRSPRAKRNFALIAKRLNRGWTPNDLARHAAISGNTVRSAERGVYVDPRSQFAMAEALDAEVLDLFPIDRQKFDSSKKGARR